jgi:hypothetical protein
LCGIDAGGVVAAAGALLGLSLPAAVDGNRAPAHR